MKREEMTCETCEFFEPIAYGSDEGECRAVAEFFHEHTVVPLDGWCGSGRWIEVREHLEYDRHSGKEERVLRRDTVYWGDWEAAE